MVDLCVVMCGKASKMLPSYPTVKIFQSLMSHLKVSRRLLRPTEFQFLNCRQQEIRRKWDLNQSKSLPPWWRTNRSLDIERNWYRETESSCYCSAVQNSAPNFDCDIHSQWVLWRTSALDIAGLHSHVETKEAGRAMSTSLVLEWHQACIAWFSLLFSHMISHLEASFCDWVSVEQGRDGDCSLKELELWSINRCTLLLSQLYHMGQKFWQGLSIPSQQLQWFQRGKL